MCLCACIRRSLREDACDLSERAISKACLLFLYWAASLSSNKWLLLPFHNAQKRNPRTTPATNVDSDQDHQSVCQVLLSKHNDTLTAASWSEKGGKETRMSIVIPWKKSSGIWVFRAQNKGHKHNKKRMGSLLWTKRGLSWLLGLTPASHSVLPNASALRQFTRDFSTKTGLCIVSTFPSRHTFTQVAATETQGKCWCLTTWKITDEMLTLWD